MSANDLGVNDVDRYHSHVNTHDSVNVMIGETTCTSENANPDNDTDEFTMEGIKNPKISDNVNDGNDNKIDHEDNDDEDNDDLYDRHDDSDEGTARKQNVPTPTVKSMSVASSEVHGHGMVVTMARKLNTNQS